MGRLDVLDDPDAVEDELDDIDDDMPEIVFVGERDGEPGIGTPPADEVEGDGDLATPEDVRRLTGLMAAGEDVPDNRRELYGSGPGAGGGDALASAPGVQEPDVVAVASSVSAAAEGTPLGVGQGQGRGVTAAVVERPVPTCARDCGTRERTARNAKEEKTRARCGRRRQRRIERDHEAERNLARLMENRRPDANDHVETPFTHVSAFARLLQNPDHFRLWLSFAGASEEDQAKFLSWGVRHRGRRNPRCEDATGATASASRSHSSRNRGGASASGKTEEDPALCRPSVSPSKAFNRIGKKLRRQLVHGHIRLTELAAIEEDVIFSFLAREEAGRRQGLVTLGDGGDREGFVYEILAGLPRGDFEDHSFVEMAEAEGKQVVAVPIAPSSRPAVQSISQYYGLTCNCLRNMAGQLYAILKNNFDDFPTPLKTLHDVAAEIKESYLVC